MFDLLTDQERLLFTVSCTEKNIIIVVQRIQSIFFVFIFTLDHQKPRHQNMLLIFSASLSFVRFSPLDRCIRLIHMFAFVFYCLFTSILRRFSSNRKSFVLMTCFACLSFNFINESKHRTALISKQKKMIFTLFSYLQTSSAWLAHTSVYSSAWKTSINFD